MLPATLLSVNKLLDPYAQNVYFLFRARGASFERHFCREKTESRGRSLVAHHDQSFLSGFGGSDEKGGRPARNGGAAHGRGVRCRQTTPSSRRFHRPPRERNRPRAL